MQPWRHAVATSRMRQSDWKEDLEIHEFIDSAKTACPDLRHRIILHNCDLGLALAEQIFDDREDIELVFSEHVKQDIGCYPSISDWVSTANRDIRVGWHRPNDEEVVRDAKTKSGLVDDAPIREILFLLTLGERYLRGFEGLGRALLMNNFGPALIRRIYGPAYEITATEGRPIIFDPSWIAEGIIVANFGKIPKLSHVLTPFSGHIQA